MAMKVVLKTIQFKRGPIDKLPKEAKYGEPILVHDEEGKYYLYAGLGEGKEPVLVSGAGNDIDLAEIENLINKALEEFKIQVEEDIDGAIEIYIGDNEELASERDIWINEDGVPDGMIEASSIRENINELNGILNDITGLETNIDISEEKYLFEEDVVETEQFIDNMLDSLNLE